MYRALIRTKISAGIMALLLSGMCHLQATAVTVQEDGISPYEIVSITVPIPYSGGVYAGLNQLLVDGVLTNGFCIDPFHFSVSGPQPYYVVDLTSAPKDDHLIAGSHMTGAEAVLISELWALAYSGIGNDAAKAAALQIAIWEVVGGSDFQLTSADDFGAGQLLSMVEAPNYSGPTANLLALTGPGQDFVIAGDPVPDGGTTLALFGLALAGLATAGFVEKSALLPNR